MKILALGGCGAMGRHAVRTLLARQACEQVTIADRDAGNARAFAAECGDRAAWCALDVDDGAALARAIGDAGLVMNTVGPFFRFGPRVLSACIEAGCHYIDICDDWEPTLAMLGLDARARDAGITAVVGMGATPGFSNVLARKAAGELDQVTGIYTGWDLESAIPETIGPRPSAATVHGFHQMTGTIRVFRDGRHADVRPLRKVRIEYPGRHAFTAWTIGHPESVTLPRYVPGLRTSQNVMVAPWPTLLALKAVTAMVDAGLLSIERAAWIGERFEGPAGPVDDWSGRLNEDREKRGPPPLFALAWGLKGGREASVGAMALSAPSGGMAGVTGVPLAVGAEMICRGRIRETGVHAPEGVVDPDEFFDRLAPFCRPVVRGAAELVEISRSWE